MRRSILGCLLFFSTPAFLFAGEFKLPDLHPIASLTIPASWKPSESEDGVEATSKDEEVSLAVQATSAADHSTETALAYLKDKGVAIDLASATRKNLSHHGLQVSETSYAGTDEDGACAIRVCLFQVSENRGLLLISWASPAGEQANLPALEKIIESVSPALPPDASVGEKNR